MRTAEVKTHKGPGMEGWTARWYARARLNEMEDFRRRAKEAAGRLRSGCEVLEVAPGPGYFAIELAKLGDYKITGLDVSETFVEIATENAREAGATIDFRLGNASAMQFADESFDFVYCSAAFKSFSEPGRAMDEIYRVLRSGGEALIEDLRRDVSIEEIESYIRESGRNWLDAWLTKMAFQHMLIKRAYRREDFEKMARESRFGACDIRTDSIGLQVTLRKLAKAEAGAA